MAFQDFTLGNQSLNKPRRMTMTIEVEDYLGYSNKQVAVIDEYSITKNFEKNGWDFHTFIRGEDLGRDQVAETYINFNSTTTNTAYPPKKGNSNMNTKVVEQAAGFVGTVFVTVDGTEVPVADTKPFKNYAKAAKAVTALAVKHARK